MKNTITLFLLSLSIIAYSQSKMIVEYDYNFAHMHGIKSFLITDHKKSYFFYVNEPDVTYKTLEKNNFLGLNNYHVFEYSQNNEEIKQRVFMIPPKIQNPIPKLAVEKLADLKWTITNKTKEILTYKAFLATAEFRGRKYNAWFTKDLPFNLFPWKLKGLPGVVLEFEDDEGYIKGIAKFIILNSNVDFPTKVTKYFDEKDTTFIIPFKKLIEYENEVLKIEMNKIIASSPKETKYEMTNIRDAALEKTFEWETAPAKF